MIKTQHNVTLLTPAGFILFGKITRLAALFYSNSCSSRLFHTSSTAIIRIIIIIQNLLNALMPLGGYRGAGGTGK